MKIIRLLVLALLLVAAPAAAESLEGSWALVFGGTTIFRFDIERDADGQWHGTWRKPSSFASDGDHFQRVKGPVKTVPSMTGIDADDGIELSFNDPRPGAVPDIFLFRQIDPDAAQMTYVGTDLAPYLLERVKPDAPVGPWDVARTYGRDASAEVEGPPSDSVPVAAPAEAESSPSASEPATEPADKPTIQPQNPLIGPDSYSLPPGTPRGR